MPTSKLRELYTVLVQDVRTMFQVCRLVHADLSEYNILYFEGRLAIIDVSQVRIRAGGRAGGARTARHAHDTRVACARYAADTVCRLGPPALL